VTKEKEWAEICKLRFEEPLAFANVIKLLNDDDALELFKKTLSSSSASFMQMQVRSKSMRTQALSDKKSDRQRIDYIIMLVIRGKKFGFEKVLKQIDDIFACQMCQ